MIFLKNIKLQLTLFLLSLGLNTILTADIPKLSDVLLTSDEIHPGIPTDPYNSFEALQSFHANNVVWVYLKNRPGDINFINKCAALNIPVQGAINTEYYYYNISPTTDLNALGIKLDVNQQANTFILANRYLGCPSSPIFQSTLQSRIVTSLGLTKDSIQIDDWIFNHFANPVSQPYNYLPNPYNCYCDYCLANFRTYLAGESASQLATWGITDVSTFDYREYLLSHNLNVYSIPYTLQIAWNSSALLTLTNFWNTNYQYIQTIAGKKVDVSTNGFGNPINGPFDFDMSEITATTANAQNVYNTIQNNLALGRRTVFIHDNTISATDVALNRQLLGWTVGSGGNLIVPWDIWINNAPRYFGNPQDYADLYGMIRAVPQYIDGYAAFKLAGANLVNPKGNSWLMVTNATTAATNTVSAFIRSNTVKSNQPWVIHLVDSAESPQSTILTLAAGQLTSNSQTSFSLTTPLPFCASLHSLAEAIGDYSILVQTIELPFVKNANGSYTIQVPPVSPWGIVVVNGTPTG